MIKLKQLLNRIREKDISHTLVTTNGNKIKCIQSLELYEGETKIIIASSIVNLRKKIITINADNIEYITENFNDDMWNSILNLESVKETEENDGRYYFG